MPAASNFFSLFCCVSDDRYPKGQVIAEAGTRSIRGSHWTNCPLHFFNVGHNSSVRSEALRYAILIDSIPRRDRHRYSSMLNI